MTVHFRIAIAVITNRPNIELGNLASYITNVSVSLKHLFTSNWGKMPRRLRRPCASYPLRAHLPTQSRFHIREGVIAIFLHIWAHSKCPTMST